MRIADVLRNKGAAVVTINPDATVRELLAGLSDQNIGAMVVVGDEGVVGIGSGPWDYEGRPSWVRLDRVLDVPEEGIRREGAILERALFEIVATRLRAEYSWS